MAERGATKHTARLDDALADDVDSITDGAPVESRADEGRLQEGAADGEPVPDARLATAATPPPGALSHADIERRSALAVALRPSAFPGTRDELLEVASEEHAPEWILDALGALPKDREFVNVEAMWEALGGSREVRDAQADAHAEDEHEAPDAPDEIFSEEVLLTEPEPRHEAQQASRREEPGSQSIVARVATLGVTGGKLVLDLSVSVAGALWRRRPGA